MEDEQLRELWKLRFQKILQAEEGSFLFYKNLLEKNQGILVGTKAKALLEKIMNEEKEHIRVAYRLLTIVNKLTPDARLGRGDGYVDRCGEPA